MALFLRCNGQRWLLKSKLFPRLSCQSIVPIATSTPLPQVYKKENFFDKNERLSRPISPHMTIYAPQITWLVSISHRVTGVALSTMATSFAIAMLCCPSNFPHYIQWIQNQHCGSEMIIAAKFLLAFPLTFHTCCGIRHLFWDMGQGFDMRAVNISGYTAIIVGYALAIGLAFM